MHENSSGHFPIPFRSKLGSETDGREGISVLVLLHLNSVLALTKLVGNAGCYLPAPPGALGLPKEEDKET